MPKRTLKQMDERKAVSTGLKDGFLTVLFASAGMLLTWVLTEVLPILDTFEDGRWSWVKAPLGLLIGAILKGIDRKKHEDPSKSTGLVKI